MNRDAQSLFRRETNFARYALLILLISGCILFFEVTLISAVAMAGSVSLSPSGKNDTAMVRSAIASAASGDVIYFAPGDYHLDMLILKSGVTYRGAAGTALRANSPREIFRLNRNDGHDITIDSLTFVGAGGAGDDVISLFGNGGPKSAIRIIVKNSTFQNNGLTFDLLRESQIISNHFKNIGGPRAAIDGWRLDNSSITGNTLINIHQGMALHFGGAEVQGRNIVVADNFGSGIQRMGIEIWGKDATELTNNLLVRGNYFTNWVDPVANAIPYSIVTNGGVGTQVLNNYASKRGFGGGGLGIEVAGPGAVARGNYLDGAGGIIGYSAGIIIENNNIINNSDREQISTFGRSDIIVRNNTSDPSRPAPSAPRAIPK